MAKVQTVVELEIGEIRDALINLAKEKAGLQAGANSAAVEYHLNTSTDKEVGNLGSATVKFSMTPKTK